MPSTVTVYVYPDAGGVETGVCFNNKFIGTFGIHPMLLDNIRCNNSVTFWGQYHAGQGFDNPYCRDQIGQSEDMFLFNENNIPTQKTEPAYFWNNTHNENPVEPNIFNNCGDWIVKGTNYKVEKKVDYEPLVYPHYLRDEEIEVPPIEDKPKRYKIVKE